MPSLHTIDAALARCRTELACLLRAEEGAVVPLPSLDVRWARQCAAWRNEHADPSLDRLYDWMVQTPAPVAVIRYMGDVFSGAKAYRHMRVYALGSTVPQSIADLFFWYYKKNILHKKWLDDGIPRGDFIEAQYVDAPDASIRQWYTTFTIEGRAIYLTWRLLPDTTLDLIFTCDPALHTPGVSWEALEAKCTDA
jgi:hypothetical protein